MAKEPSSTAYMTEVEYKDRPYRFVIIHKPSFPLWYVAIEPLESEASEAHLSELYKALNETGPESYFKPNLDETWPVWSTLYKAKDAVERSFLNIHPTKRWGLLIWDGKWHRG